jgi:L-fucose isomerase-like protein
MGDYITNKNWLKEGRLTMARILKRAGGGFTLHSATGKAVGDIGAVSEYGAPQYAFTEVVLDKDVYTFAQDSGSHHYALVYDDLNEAFSEYCKYTGLDYLQD